MLLTERNEIKINILVISNLSYNLFDKTFSFDSNTQTSYMSPEVFKSQVMVTDYYPNFVSDIWYEMFYL